MPEATRRKIVMDAEALAAFLTEHYPQAAALNLDVEHVDEWSIRVRMSVRENDQQPGGAASGATMATLADVAMHLMVLAQIGPTPPATAANLNINLLSRPQPGNLIAMGQLLKLGKRLAVGEVGIYAEGDTRPAAHATLTYSIPSAED